MTDQVSEEQYKEEILAQCCPPFCFQSVRGVIAGHRRNKVINHRQKQMGYNALLSPCDEKKREED